METTCPGARLAGSAMRRRLPAAILRRSVAGLLLALGLSRCAANKATPPVAVAQDGGDAGASWICDNACTLADDGPKVRFAAATELSGIAASAVGTIAIVFCAFASTIATFALGAEAFDQVVGGCAKLRPVDRQIDGTVSIVGVGIEYGSKAARSGDFCL